MYIVRRSVSGRGDLALAVSKYQVVVILRSLSASTRSCDVAVITYLVLVILRSRYSFMMNSVAWPDGSMTSG